VAMMQMPLHPWLLQKHWKQVQVLMFTFSRCDRARHKTERKEKNAK
jgi:hypothetical protein